MLMHRYLILQIFATLLALATASPWKLIEETPEVAAVAPVVHFAHVAPVVHFFPFATHYSYAAFAPKPVEALPVHAPVAPVEDTPEVAAAKISFIAAFDAASAGEHAALAPKPLPVPTPVVPVQGPSTYLADTPEVTAAKISFKAAFDAAVAGEHAALASKPLLLFHCCAFCLSCPCCGEEEDDDDDDDQIN